MLGTERLSLGYPGRTLCRELSVTIRPGQCWGILGQNGSGKTTLLHALSGLVPPLDGKVLLDGKPIQGFSRRALARKIGLLLQEEEGGYWGTVRDYVSLGRFPHGGNGDDLVAAAMHRMELDALAARTLASLSGGERQRARIALLLAQAPDIYCLDEPLLHLDLRHQAEVMRMCQQLAHDEGKVVVMVLHEPHWASRYCDHVLLLHGDGIVMTGVTADMMTHERLQSLYQCKLDVVSGNNQALFLPVSI